MLSTVPRSRVLALVAVAALIAIAIPLASSVSKPTYTNGGSGIELGSAQRRSPRATDLLAQVAAGALGAAAGSAGIVAPEVGDTQLTPRERALLDLTNAARAEHGLGPTTFDPAALRVARVRAEAQLPSSSLSHYDSLGALAFVGLLAEAGVSYALAGENLARSTAADETVVARLHEALMNSPTHRANILEPSFNRLAVGAALGEGERIAFAEIFRSINVTDGLPLAP
jgi:uncharacterized protein YkwD